MVLLFNVLKSEGMKIQKVITFIFLLMILGCDSSNKQSKSNHFTDENQTTTENQDESFDSDLENEQNDEQEQKYVSWKDGNSYSYDFEDYITKTDSNGNEIVITVYRSYKPSNAEIQECEVISCKWCSKELYGEKELSEVPDVSWLSPNPDLKNANIFNKLDFVDDFFTGLFSSPFQSNYYDFKNNKVRTEWVINCKYVSTNPFCSLKCKNEFENN
jgi:hypothetical protein